jgi:uncharacterized membrane protein YjjP (DUF1212 family)
MADDLDPVRLRHRHLEQIVLVALRAGRLLMEAGARAEVVQEGSTMVARGLGADEVHVRVGYASVAGTVSSGSNTVTRMIEVGRHGVNVRLNHALRGLCSRIGQGGMSAEEASAAVSALVRETPRYPWYLTAAAVGLACASFGRLLGADWVAFAPILLAGAVGQGVRHQLLKAGTNVYVVAAVVGFLAAWLAGICSRLAGSATVETAMIAAVLLLVPGVPLLNAQTDIMEGHPTLGSARSVSVAMILVFIAVGVFLAQWLSGGAPPAGAPQEHGVAHQTLFGALAAAGFGVLFNFGPRSLVWAALAGALALAVRTVGLQAGWSLEAASFAAAVAVGFGVQVLHRWYAIAGNALAVAGCIPMIPGSAAAKASSGCWRSPRPSRPPLARRSC